MENTVRKFEIMENSIEVPGNKRGEIKEGISLTSNDQYPKLILSFDSLTDAKAELQKYKSTITELCGSAGKYYLVKEYYIEENLYDEYGEWIEGGGVHEFSKFTIELVEKPSYKVIKAFSNIKDAEEACHNYEGENEVYLSF